MLSQPIAYAKLSPTCLFIALFPFLWFELMLGPVPVLQPSGISSLVELDLSATNRRCVCSPVRISRLFIVAVHMLVVWLSLQRFGEA